MIFVNQTTYEKGKLYQLSMSSLSPDPEQPRKFFDEQALAELQASIVRQKTAEKMTALYSKYKESGLTRGEIRKKTTPKAIKKPLTTADVSGWAEKLDTIIIADMTAEQKIALRLEVEKLRGVA